MAGRLLLVATPIGNLADLSPRALEALRDCDFVVCEDTRRTLGLLTHHGLQRPLVSLPAFDEAARLGPIVARLAAGETAALVTDAGSPGISDPGEALVAAAVAQGVTVTPVPGPAALIAALTASGLPSARFHFLGFLPRQASKAREMLEEVRDLRATLVLYEAPSRVADTLALLTEALGPRRACLARELTKLHEDFVRAPLDVLLARCREAEPRGEVVLVVEGRTGDARWAKDEVERALRAGLDAGVRLKDLAAEVARRAGWPAREVYRLGVDARSEDP